jgi:DNA-binding NtrC family response regulator
MGPADVVRVLSIGAQGDEYSALQQLFKQSPWELCPGFHWTLENCGGVSAATMLWQDRRAPIVLCSADMESGSWRDLLAWRHVVECPPRVIVTARQADERLWAEALNLGAYDLLPAPFNTNEVIRTLSHAFLTGEGCCDRKGWAQAGRCAPGVAG